MLFAAVMGRGAAWPAGCVHIGRVQKLHSCNHADNELNKYHKGNIGQNDIKYPFKACAAAAACYVLFDPFDPGAFAQ